MSRYAIAGENDADVMPCTRNVMFGVWGVCLLSEIALFAGMQYFISESISIAEKLSLHIATSSLSVTIVIALLVYWLQKIDEGKERWHRRDTAAICAARR